MSAQSSLHAVEQLSSSNGLLSFPSVQSFTSYGGHGVDHFRVHVRNSMVEERESKVEVEVGECSEGSSCGWIQEVDLLVIPSYYGCNRGQTECNATHVYYHWNSSIHQFMDSISIPSSGPSQTDHFSTNGNSYLLIAENFINQLTMYRMDAMRIGTDDIDLQAVKVQGVTVPGIAACATAVIDGNTYVIAASYHDRGWQTTSTVYRLDEDSDALIIHHTIPTTGAHDVETIEYHGNHFLIFSEDRNSESVLISSNIYLWNAMSARYDHLQAVPTDGAHAAEFFVMNDTLFVAIANFGDRHNARYHSNSSVFQFVVREGANEQKVGSFQWQASVNTYGATDWEYFELSSGIAFLAVSEEADMKRGVDSPFASRVYRLDSKIV